MDVKCERCNTEYEFDDALVSGRGTTVKCTNCGHKFKIRRGEGDAGGDYWNVTTGDGRTLVFTSLRELQRAIQAYLVERTDRLSRGGLPPKPIGQIPELAPFFDQREASKTIQTGPNPPARSGKTHDGIGPPAAAAAAAASHPPPIRARQLTRPEFPGPPPSSSDPNAGKSTLIGTGPLTSEEAIPRPGPPPAPPRPGAGAGALKSTPPPVPTSPRREAMNTMPLKRPSVPSMPPGGSQSPTPPPLPERARSAPPTPPPAALRTNPPPGVRTQPPPPPPAHRHDTASAPPVPSLPARSEDLAPRRSLLAEIEDERRPRFESVPEFPPTKTRRPVGGFIVAVVVVGGLLMLGAVWAQKNLGGLTGNTKPVPSTTVADPRIAGFLVAGEKAIADGNLEVAKDSFDNARHLAEKDPRVLLALARLAAARADVPWLKQRILALDAVDEQHIAKNELAELAAIARRTADDALAVAPDDPAALRAKIDALRIADDRATARELVKKINTVDSSPETAYVVGALDLADTEPLWAPLLEKLKTASSVETGPGRGRAALVYALARSGDVAGAKAEVDRLSAMPRTHPLLPQLRSFTEHAKAVAKNDAGLVDATKPPGNGSGAGGIVPAGGGGGGGGGVPSDPREMLSQAEKARGKGDYERARTLYNAAVEKNPNDSEALNGLAVIAYQQKDLPAARAAYKRVLAINPNFMPALIGAADVEWDSGDHASATKMYKEIVDRYPENAYPARVKQRSEG